jgi:hypothetical protein
MAHTLAGVTIHPDGGDDNGKTESMYSRQNVLDATVDTIGYYGAKSETKTLNFTLIENIAGAGSLNTLKASVKANSDTTYVNDLGTTFTCRILSLSYTRLQALNYNLPVYKCSAELVSTT